MKIKKILVSQPKPSSEKSPYFDLESKYGVEIVFRPFIKVEGLSSKEFRQQKISIGDYTAVIFTARTAVDNYFRLAKELRYDVPDTMKYFCISETVAHYLQKYTVYRKRKIFYSENGHADGLMPLIEKHKKEVFLYPVSDVHESKLPELETKDINFRRAVMYRTVSNDFGPDEKFDYDVLLFFSPAGIDSLLKNFPDFNQDNVAIGCLGAATAKAVTDAGLRLDIQAPSAKAPSMTAALDLFLQENMDKED